MKYLKKINEIIDDDYDDSLFIVRPDDDYHTEREKDVDDDDHHHLDIPSVFKEIVKKNTENPIEKPGSKKKVKEKKKFDIGDILILVNKEKTDKLPTEAKEFLLTYKKFKVLDVKENLNIHIGCLLDNGNKYYFNPNRFEKMT